MGKGHKNRTRRTDVELTPDRVSGSTINWYPGHMAKALRQVKEKMKGVDIILEIRDARVPLTSGNAALEKTIGGKQKIVALNKCDLADPKAIEKWSSWFKKNNVDHLFVNSLNKSSLKKLVDQARKSVIERKIASGSIAPGSSLRMMVIGLPNTGKSTFINTLAGKKVARTADRPGHTQSQQWVNIDKDLLLMDTPGIMPPDIATDEQGYWLCAIHAIKDDIIGKEEVAFFVMRYFLEKKSTQFMERYNLPNLEVTPLEVLDKIAVDRKCLMQKGLPDYERVYGIILHDFRSGDLGHICLEHPPVE
ncbi:MAG: ribosome biogenesis GTPase YlqF [Bacteriovoracaceae bacterium]|nr:ribosome biogenesis GTPase YlqF [Bacteriovoracaceae bacterium]